MADVNISPNMNLPIPVTGQTVGPNWSNDYNNSLALVDAHNHAPGSGVQINPTGILINADLPYFGNNATILRSARFSPQSVPISAAADVGCLYESGVDLYYNDGNGNQIRITQSGSVAGSAGTITGLPSGTASAAFQSSSGTFQFLQATSTGANMDAATLIVRYPGSYPTPAGNYVAIQAPTSLSGGYAFTLPATTAAASGAWLTSDTAGTLSYTNADNSTVEINAATLRVKALGITAAQMANATITGTQVSSNINLAGKAVQENGNNVLVSNTNATNSLAMVRGFVDTAGDNPGSGTSRGEGWTCSFNGGTKLYTITFSSSFGDTPMMCCTGTGQQNIVITVNSISSSTATVSVVSGGTFVQNPFHFIAIGQRA